VSKGSLEFGIGIWNLEFGILDLKFEYRSLSCWLLAEGFRIENWELRIEN